MDNKVIRTEEHERLKDAELDSIIKQAEQDYREGRYRIETAKEHFKRLGI